MTAYFSKVIIAILCIIASVSCTIVLPMSSMETVFRQVPNKLIYHTFENGSKIKQEVVTVGDKKYDQLKNWLLAHNTGWATDFVSYVPIELFWSKKMNINVQSNVIVINYNDGKDWNQISIKRKHGSKPYNKQIWTKNR